MASGKCKTNSAAKKRVKVTGTGKILFCRNGFNHLLRKKKKSRKYRGNRLMVVDSLRQQSVIRQMLAGFL